jgi:hypothetical protein
VSISGLARWRPLRVDMSCMMALCRHEVVAAQRIVSGSYFLIHINNLCPERRDLQAVLPCMVSSSGLLSLTLLRVRLFNLDERDSRWGEVQLENAELVIGASISIALQYW